MLNGPGPKPGTGGRPSTTPGVDGRGRHAAAAALRLLGLTLPGMRARGWGRVLAVGSSGVAAPLPNLALSNLGRAALAGVPEDPRRRRWPPTA